MCTLRILYYLCWLLPLNALLAQNAPVSTISIVVSFEQSAEIGISVSGFSNIGSCNLKILYDASVLHATSVSLGPQVPGMLSTDINVPGAVSIGWYWFPAVTLPDGTVFLRIVFSRLNLGHSLIAFDVENSVLCSWWNGAFNLLNDIPPSDYYISGAATMLRIDEQYNYSITDHHSTNLPFSSNNLPAIFELKPAATHIRTNHTGSEEEKEYHSEKSRILFGSHQTGFYYHFPEKAHGLIEIFSADGKKSGSIQIPWREPGAYYEKFELSPGLHIARIYLFSKGGSESRVIKFYASP